VLVAMRQRFERGCHFLRVLELGKRRAVFLGFAIQRTVVLSGGLVVALDRLVRIVRNALFEHLEIEDADQTVAAFHVMVEKAQRLPRVVSFDPEGDLAEVNREGILIDRVDALADYVARRVTERARRRLFFSGPDLGEFAAHPTRGREKEMS
jgi:hypothetical protein